MPAQQVHLQSSVSFEYPCGDVDRDARAVPGESKWSYVTRNVEMADVGDVSASVNCRPQPGDLILARVARIAQHTKVQLRSGRRSQLFVDDYLVLAYGNRYAPDQFEAEVPAKLDRCHMVAAGGIAAKATAKHSKLKWPTLIQPEGFLLDRAGRVMNLAQYKTVHLDPAPSKPVLAVAGTSMNSGKTTTMAALTKGLTRAGYRVAAVKVTGTGAGNDMWAYEDAGAVLTLDFTDAGHASTFRVPQQGIRKAFAELVSTARRAPAVDVVLVEIADGLLHCESAELLGSRLFRRTCSQVIFAAGEAMGAKAGVELLRAMDLPVTGVSGVVSASALARQEAAVATGVTVFTKGELESADIGGLLA